MNARGSIPRDSAGFSLTELMAVMALLGVFVVIAVPNIIGAHERYLLRANATGVASFLKLTRMKAVANNEDHKVELDGPVADQCAGASSPGRMMVIYRDRPAQAPESCHPFDNNIPIDPVPAGADAFVTFKPNGMTKDERWFLVKSRNQKICQLVCANLMGAVYFNPATEDACLGPAYAASDDTPCKAPVL